MSSYRRIAVLVLLLVSAVSADIPAPPAAAYRLWDNFEYTTDQARQRWVPMTDSRPVSVVATAGKNILRMPCHFAAGAVERASWDSRAPLDLGRSDGVQFYFFCDDPGPVADFCAYFHSGDGWYRAHFQPPAPGRWCLIQIAKSDTQIEGQPAGWSRIDTLRISAWRGQNTDTEFHLAHWGYLDVDRPIGIVRAESVMADPARPDQSPQEYCQILRQYLETLGLPSCTLGDLDLTGELLGHYPLIILPHNPSLPERSQQAIRDYLQGGGKIIACYHLSDSLAETIGIRIGSYLRRSDALQFASIRPSERPLEGMPPITQQDSWNMYEAAPLDARGRVAAWWFDPQNRSTGKAAIVAATNGIFVSHVLTREDPSAKAQLLLAMLAELEPDLKQQVATQSLETCGRFGTYADFAAARREIAARATEQTTPLLRQADQYLNQARQCLEAKDYFECLAQCHRAQDALREAYCTVLPSATGEHRAFWCHSASGIAGMDWDRAIRILAENGFTAILPNMLWAGAAYYPSEVLPRAEGPDQADQIALCLAACKKYGIACHVWKVNYNMGSRTPRSFRQRMKEQGRTQVDFDQTANDRWLCPSHPDNQTLEIESMLEVARNYDVQGLHFDYIRYPGRQGCFCAGCRQRFEAAIGRKVEPWPAAIRQDETLEQRWLDFRRRQITTVVSAVAERGRSLRPNLKISAAVFNNWPVHRDEVGQDWKLWCEKGYLDFVCPMDYTASSSHFQGMIERQLAWSAGVPCYPGIGLSTWTDADEIMLCIEQIQITRQLHTGGFTIFNLAAREAREILPLLGKGLTRPAGP
ncbi:MAG: family 10 glycosylhydrolase [Sedimentisphaerales bacterium]|nr:family 10 glycosylhydrolase [Sedimentisphaerales bacterium]